ncbi:MAG TPA: tetratricopeptide repeat protein, partial [Flavisolibacter sp.]|nr:tetratricopeptide repeat protein [Flavisolibacter sp.]
MRVRSHIHALIAIILLVNFAKTSHAQPGHTIDIKKEKPYEERKLKAEKTGEGKIKTPKRIFQNLTTRFNYYFNASNKFNEILERAKAQHKDDFSQLLPFYNYSLEATAADSLQLDSVIYKCRTGIINHDLRNEWIDELYLLWAASWHLEKKLDSASMMLQFINYAYAPQEEYGFYTHIGTRKEGAQELSIATKEDKKFLHSNTFSRNNAFIWQIRTLIELGNFASSGSLITTLKRDPAFPKRLNNALEEAEAYWYYKQGRWDSAATHLIEAVDGAGSRSERARWEYLIAQLLERSGKSDEAAKFYTKAISSTNDPVLELYGRLNIVRTNKEGGENAIDKNVAELLKMARRDKYEEYRDIIYYMAAQMEMERNNIAAAQELLMKGAKYSTGNQSSRNKAFLQIADVSFNQKKYLQAASFYDSVQVNDLSEAESRRVFQRKTPLQLIAENTRVVARQDSLQRIAAMPQEQREDYIKKLVKQLRKQQGLKDEGAPTAGSQPLASQPAELFPNQNKGEWYFYNNNSRTQGAAQFKQLWGNRPNADNWRRFAVVSQQAMNRDPNNLRDTKDPARAAPGADNVEITFESLSAKLPTTPATIKTSNDSIRTALFNLGTAFLNDLEDYESAINAFEEIRRRFPDAEKMDEVLFNLNYAYTKAGNTTQAAQTKKLLQDKFPSSRSAAIVTTGKDPQATTDNSPEATKAYENVYNMFIEGRFDKAIAAKRAADSTYKTTFWQPQLLYIEAVYHIKQRDDSSAKSSLQTIVNQNTNQALTEKAQNLLSVLSRRQQIEAELNAYQMQNQPAPDTATQTKDTAAAVKIPDPQPADTLTAKRPVINSVQQQPVKNNAVTIKPPVAKAIDSIAKQQAIQKPAADTVAKKPVEKQKTDTL